MWETRDLTCVILIAVMSFIYTVAVGQLGHLVTGIIWFNYLFTVGHMIFISFGFLTYEGKRWRLLLQGVLVALLTLSTYLSGVPFDLVSKIPMIFTSFFADLIFNTFYPFFKKRNWLKWLSILFSFSFVLLSFLFNTLNIVIFYPPQSLSAFVSLYALLLPLTLIETALGGWFGFEIYKRVERPQGTK